MLLREYQDAIQDLIFASFLEDPWKVRYLPDPGMTIRN